MTEFKFAIGVTDTSAAYAMGKASDPSQNGLHFLGKAVIGGNIPSLPDGDAWHAAALGMLESLTIAAGLPHVAIPGDTSGDNGWFAVFETVNHDLWFARYFEEELTGTPPGVGIYLVSDDPAQMDLTTLGDGQRPLRSFVTTSANAIGDAQTRGKNSGG